MLPTLTTIRGSSFTRHRAIIGMPLTPLSLPYRFIAAMEPMRWHKIQTPFQVTPHETSGGEGRGHVCQYRFYVDINSICPSLVHRNRLVGTRQQSVQSVFEIEASASIWSVNYCVGLMGGAIVPCRFARKSNPNQFYGSQQF